jgi:hypothetical protein
MEYMECPKMYNNAPYCISTCIIQSMAHIHARRVAHCVVERWQTDSIIGFVWSDHRAETIIYLLLGSSMDNAHKVKRN